MVFPWDQKSLRCYQIIPGVHRVPEDSNPLIKQPKEINSPDSQWVVSIKQKLERACQEHAAGSRAQLSIYRIPHYLRDGNDKAYVPQIVSLGPYHRRHKPLYEMDRHKWRCLHQILKRTNQDVKIYLDSIKELEERASAFYQEPLDLSSDEFVEMLILDGLFVLEFFQGITGGFERLGYPQDDPIFAMRGTMHSIQRDMIMLENQLPLFVLDQLLQLQLSHSYQKGQVATLALKFFDPLVPTDESFKKSDTKGVESSRGHENISCASSDQACQSGLHCLDVFRRSLLRTGCPTHERGHVNRVADKRQQQLIHCVTELRDAGVKFRKRETDRFWDIEFKNGILSIPRLLIHDSTRSLFLNFIAFEQCHLACSNHITSYMIFMDNLIDTPEDVRYLHDHGIIEHWLGSDAEVANLFNRLCEEVFFDVNSSYLCHLSEKINGYYKCQWNGWRASLKHNHCKNPWAIISLLAAVILLLLTLAQTFYTVYGYYRPPG